MAFIPKDAKWYLAEIVLKITVEDDPRNVVHTNWVLVRADSPEEAYERSLSLGRQWEGDRYENPAGKMVRTDFCGLRDLNVIHEELEDGAEITFEEEIGLSDEEIRKKISSKDRLGVFRPLERSDRPDYASKEIIDEARKLLAAKNEPEDSQ